MTASANVARVVNFYSSTNGWGVAIGRGAGFRGSLSNVDLSRRGEMGHTDIDKSPALHAQSIGFIQSIGGGNSRTSAAAPKSDADKTNGAKPESKDDSKPGSDAAAKPAAGRTETAASPSAPSAPASN